jgi:DNA ligase 1
VRRFADLYERLDTTTSTSAKVSALREYFASAPPEDAAWTLFFLTGRRFKRLLGSGPLFQWTVEQTGLPAWLVSDSMNVVGDMAETIALLVDRGVPVRGGPEVPLHVWIEQRILPLRLLELEDQRRAVVEWWRELPRRELFLLNKLLTAEFRVGVSAILVMRAVALLAGLPPATVAHRLMGDWEPSAEFFRALIAPQGTIAEQSHPYPFCLAYPLEMDVAVLGPREEWLTEWKWDGIRTQLVRRGGRTFLWSRGEELISERFPEVTDAARAFADGIVLDGEVIAFQDGRPLPFAMLQRRIGRQKLTPKILADAPAVMIVYDVLEHEGRDIRDRPLRERREILQGLLARAPRVFHLSEAVDAPDWTALAELRRTSRSRSVEGFMLKHLDSPYHAGRKKGDWWKWKIDPHSVDAVLLYAQYGSGRRANLFTDYTFAVWNEGELLPIAKAYSGLSDEEIAEVDRWVRTHTLEKFGPVRAVEPVQVFELHFEALARSSRHKSGIAVRFPRIARWRKDKRPEEADTLERLRAMIETPR